jgi:asparagine synthase (glutamine-hydrolysing)
MTAFAGRLGPHLASDETRIHQALDQMPGRGGTIRQVRRFGELAAGIACSEVESPDLQAGFAEGLCLIWDGTIFSLTLDTAEPRSSVKSAADILSLYLREGPGFVSKLNGPFALVLWDARQQRVLMARDPLGIRPLFYSIDKGELTFASEIRALLRLGTIDRALDLEALQDYLAYLWIPAPRTLIRGVRQVAPGEIVSFSHDGVCSRCTFRKAIPHPFVEVNEAQWCESLYELVLESLRRRVSSNRRLGFLLSGGTDTAVLAGCAAKDLGMDVKTFTLGFRDAIDERVAAKETARFLGTQHHDFEITEACIEKLPEITRCLGNPVGNPASLISHELFGYLKDHVDQVICGDGGNEVLGGCYKYNQTMNFAAASHSGWIARTLQRAGRQFHFRVRETALEPIFQQAARTYFAWLGRDGRSREATSGFDFDEVANFYARLETCWPRSAIRSLCTQNTIEAVRDYDPLRSVTALFVHDPDLSPLQQLIYVRTNTFIPYNVMPYVEVNASAANVECLFPLLDHDLLDFIYRVPFDYIYGKSYRHLMRESFAGRIVPAKLFRKPLSGFQPPRDRWMQTASWRAYVNDHLSGETVAKRGLFSRAYIDSLLAQFHAGNKFLVTNEGARAQPVAESIWSLLALEVWCREFLDSPMGLRTTG